MFNTTETQHQTLQIFAACTLLLMAGALVLPPLQAVMLINSWHSPDRDMLATSITLLGDGLILLPVFLVLLFIRFYWAIALIFNAALQGIVVSIFKRVLFPHALRPINFLDPATIHTIPNVAVHKMMTFPSGHTVTAFGIFIFLALCTNSRSMSWWLVAAAVLAGISRVYLLQHFLWDVAAGAVIGSAIGALSYLLVVNIQKPAWMHQRIELGSNRNRRRSWS